MADFFSETAVNGSNQLTFQIDRTDARSLLA
jgi:hypothetical protein